MKRKQNKTGLTLLEILVAITIMAILAAGLYTVSSSLEKQAKGKLTRATIDTLCTALQQYREFYGKFPFEAGSCYDRNSLEANEPNGLNGDVTDKDGNPLPAANYNNIYASSEALYHFLNKCPSSKKIIGSINPSLLANKDNKNTEYFFDPNGVEPIHPLVHIIDAWKTPLRYTYKQGDNFPVIQSAGPNKKSGDDDDISSK